MPSTRITNVVTSVRFDCVYEQFPLNQFQICFTISTILYVWDELRNCLCFSVVLIYASSLCMQISKICKFLMCMQMFNVCKFNPMQIHLTTFLDTCRYIIKQTVTRVQYTRSLVFLVQLTVAATRASDKVVLRLTQSVCKKDAFQLSSLADDNR